MRGGSLTRFHSDPVQGGRGLGGHLASTVLDVIKGGLSEGLQGLRESRSVGDLLTKPTEGFKRGASQAVKRKLAETLLKEGGRRLVKRAKKSVTRQVKKRAPKIVKDLFDTV